MFQYLLSFIYTQPQETPKIPTYHTIADSNRVHQVELIIETINKYFVNYSEYYESRYENVLAYRMLEMKTWISSKFNNTVHPVFLNSLTSYNTKEKLELCLFKLGDENLSSLYKLFKEYKEKKEEIEKKEKTQ